MMVRLALGLALFLLRPEKVAALEVQTARGHALLEATTVRRAPALTATDVASMEDAVRLLDTSPMSCVTFDAAKSIASFTVKPEDFYHQRKHSTANTVCRDHPPVSSTLMVPTYMRHQLMYNRLVESARRFIVSHTALVSVFSSEEESAWMTGNCSACASTPELKMRALIFDYSYENFTINARKANYQTAKKLWALQHVDYDSVLMLDSDFAFIRPIALPEVLAPYQHVLYEMPPKISGGILRGMMKLLTTRFNTTQKDYIPFEMPWIYNKGLVTQLVEHLGDRYVEDILNEENRLFDVLIYRVFVLTHNPEFFSKHIRTDKLWFEARDVAESERLAIQPPPIAVRHSLQEKRPCKICWLEAHADRDGN